MNIHKLISYVPLLSTFHGVSVLIGRRLGVDEQIEKFASKVLKKEITLPRSSDYKNKRLALETLPIVGNIILLANDIKDWRIQKSSTPSEESEYHPSVQTLSCQKSEVKLTVDPKVIHQDLVDQFILEVGKFSGLKLEKEAILEGKLDLSSQMNEMSSQEKEQLLDSISKLTFLETLDISGNSDIFLPESLCQITGLKNLNLSYCELEYVPDWIDQFQELEVLVLSGYKGEPLPESLLRLKKLKSLDLYHYDLNTLPDWFGQLNELEVLVITRPMLREMINFSSVNVSQFTFPESFQHLTHLKKLYLGCLMLKALPDWFGQFSSLEELILKGNNITSLPESLGNLTHLKKLDLSNSQLTSLPEWFGQLESLEEVNLSSNWKISLPESFQKLRNLKMLSLNWCKFETIPEWFGQLTSLEELNLEGDMVQFLPEEYEIVKTLPVKKISLKKSRLDTFPTKLCALPYMEELDVSMESSLRFYDSLLVGNFEISPTLKKLNVKNCLPYGKTLEWPIRYPDLDVII